MVGHRLSRFPAPRGNVPLAALRRVRDVMQLTRRRAANDTFPPQSGGTRRLPMTLLYPVWLLLLLPLAALLWTWPPPGRLQTALRASALILVLLALCGLAITLPSQSGTVVVVCDRSASMPDTADRDQSEAINILQSAMGSDDRLAVVAFGNNVVLERPPDVGQFPGFQYEVRNDASNLTEALEMALSVIPSDAPGKVLILSDGRWTGRDPTAAGARAASREVPIDFRLMERP